MPVIKNDNYSNDQEASPQHKLRIYAYVRVPTIIGKCSSASTINHEQPLRQIRTKHHF